MNAELTPAVVASGGGSLLMGGILFHEHRREEAMRASRVRLGLRFPLGLEPSAALGGVEKLAGVSEAGELVVEVTASQGHIAHAVWVPAGEVAAVTALLSGALGTVRVEPADGPVGRASLALRLFVPARSFLHVGEPVSASRALLSGMATLREEEQVVVRWALRPGRPKLDDESDAHGRLAREMGRAWRHKTERPGLFAAGLVLVRAGSVARARELAGQVESVIRGRRGARGAIRITSERGNRSLASLPKVSRGSGWLSAEELLGLIGWPLGAAVPGVEPCAPVLPVPEGIPREGRRLFVGRDWRGERPVALDAAAARHHTLIIGPSGCGKSELLARCILDDISAGHGGVVIDPKADLVQAVLDRVSGTHTDRVVVLDPADTTRAIPGLALLRGGDADLRADVLVGALRSIFADVWGVRSDWFGRLGIRTLAEVPGATLADLARLFTDDAYRRGALAHVDDEFLRAAWQSYEQLSPGAQVEHVQAPLNRVMELLSRPRVRAVLASPDPKLDVGRLLAERKWLLVSLAPGRLGEAGARLLGAAVMYLVWSAIEARAGLPEHKRHLLNLYVDELATLESLPFSFELLAERARGLGAGLTVATQSLARVNERTRLSLMANAATLVSFRAPAEESARIARALYPLTATEVQSLGRFEVAARVASGAGSAGVLVTGRTEPLPAPIPGAADAFRSMSALRYGARPAPPNPKPAPPSVEGDIGVRPVR
jgi:hypothetical protein